MNVDYNQQQGQVFDDGTIYYYEDAPSRSNGGRTTNGSGSNISQQYDKVTSEQQGMINARLSLLEYRMRLMDVGSDDQSGGDGIVNVTMAGATISPMAEHEAFRNYALVLPNTIQVIDLYILCIDNIPWNEPRPLVINSNTLIYSTLCKQLKNALKTLDAASMQYSLVKINVNSFVECSKYLYAFNPVLASYFQEFELS